MNVTNPANPEDRYSILKIPKQGDLVEGITSVYDNLTGVFLPVSIGGCSYASKALRSLTEEESIKGFVKMFELHKLVPWVAHTGSIHVPINLKDKNNFCHNTWKDFARKTAVAYAECVNFNDEFTDMMEKIDELCSYEERQRGVEFEASELFSSIVAFGETETPVEVLNQIFDAGRGSETVKLLNRFLEDGEPIESEAVKAW